MRVFIVGCGGVGSFLTASMSKLVGPQNITLVDKDKLESKNMDRQLFREGQIGQFKAAALAEIYGCTAMNEWYSLGLTEHFETDWILCVVDNHPGRASVLEACDFSGCSAIFGANETFSSEAYVYRPEWKNQPRDPRVYYREIIESHEGDPRRAAIGCTGEAQVQTPQLVSANFMAAALTQHLFVMHAMEGMKVDVEVRAALPHKLVANLSKLENHKQ